MSITCDIGPEFYSVTQHRARKQYSCCECNAPILAGEPYLKCVGKWDGELDTYRQHLVCEEACEFVRDNIQDGECLPFGSLKEWWDEEGKWLDTDRAEIKQFRVLYAKVIRLKRSRLK